MITEDTAWLIFDACRILDRPTRELSVCEFGNQETGHHVRCIFKWLALWLGMDHVSIDQNGSDGALPFDLSQPFHIDEAGPFDVVTNFGTTEHVFTTGDLRDQWQAFKTMHDLAKEEAVLIHVLPDEEGAHGNCGYVYREHFLPDLAKVCGYNVREFYDSKSDLHHRACLMVKMWGSRFPEFEEFVGIGGIQRVR